jgi:hypothetical protein
VSVGVESESGILAVARGAWVGAKSVGNHGAVAHGNSVGFELESSGAAAAACGGVSVGFAPESGCVAGPRFASNVDLESAGNHRPSR